jgi:hypothetical protein
MYDSFDIGRPWLTANFQPIDSDDVAGMIADFPKWNSTAISNVSHIELVVALAAARVDLGGDRVDALPVNIKRPQKFGRIEPKVWLNVLQGVSLDNE